VDCEENKELDWLPPPPKVSGDVQKLLGENSTIKELRYMHVNGYRVLIDIIYLCFKKKFWADGQFFVILHFLF
jgi:hypothetical protein